MLRSTPFISSLSLASLGRDGKFSYIQRKIKEGPRLSEIQSSFGIYVYCVMRPLQLYLLILDHPERSMFSLEAFVTLIVHP